MVTATRRMRAAKAGRPHVGGMVCLVLAIGWAIPGMLHSSAWAQTEPPCADCGPGPHWIHTPNCPPGGMQINEVDTGAILGIDTNFDCIADSQIVLGGTAQIRVQGALDDSAQFPGTRPVDGHLDVIDTEIIAMQLTGGGVQLVAGAGLGLPPGLPSSRGTVAETFSNPALADSFFDVFVEITLPGGNIAYNWQPVHVQQVVDCVMPDANFLELDACIPLFDRPPGQPGGVPVGNLVRTEHFTYPGCCRPDGTCIDGFSTQECAAAGGTVVPSCLGDLNGDGRDEACPQNDPVACCLPLGQCVMMPAADCAAQNGIARPAGVLCQGDLNGDGIDDACFDPPCAQCGPGPHFIDVPGCPPGGSGADTLPSGAVAGIDTNFDCVADVNVVAFGPVTIGKVGPFDDSGQFPGLRPVDGHNDVIDTEIIAMQLTGGGVTITAGAGLGAQPLSPTLGAIAEQPGNPSLADSFFDVFFEIDMGGGTFGYNWMPIKLAQVIDCVPPKNNYHHLSGCTPLFSSPIPGQGVQIGNLVAANHFTYPDCCRPDGTCVNNVAADVCKQGGGTVVTNCLGDANSNGSDDACEPKCEVDAGSPTGCSDTCPPPATPNQQCLPSAYGCNPDQPGTCGVLACDCNCHLVFTPVGPTCQGGCPDGTPCTLYGDGSIGNAYRCNCDPVTGSCCLPDGNCINTTSTDCAAQGGTFHPGVACSGTQEACCFADGTCKDLDPQCCLDHGGTPQGPGSDCTQADVCGGPTFCPLPTSGQPWCANLQTSDCAGSSTEQCMPAVVTVTPQPVSVNVLACDCAFDQCGPVDIVPVSNGYIFRCPFACPDATKKCVIYRNGFETPDSFIHSSQVLPGEEITCDCSDGGGGDVCPMPAGQDICAPRQQTDCQTTNNSELCEPISVSITATGEVAADQCRCAVDNKDCGPVIVAQTPNGTFISCDAQCPNPPGGDCVIHRNGISTGQIQAPVTAFVPGDQLSCGCSSNLCPLPAPPAVPWCQARQPIDCQEGATAEQCRPLVVSTTTAGGVDVRQCDCLGDGCGPIDITQHADGTFTYRCVNACPDPATQECLIHRNGVATTLLSIHSSQVSPNDAITCDCVDEQPVCPLQPGQMLCAARQTIDCTDPVAGETCKPEVVSIGNNLQVTAEQCDCLPDGPCGPVLFFPDAPGATTGMVSCDAACPDPDQQCVIWRNGASTGQVQAHSSTFAAGDSLTCDCDPPSTCPMPPNFQPWCQFLQSTDCQDDGVAGEQCWPMIVSTNAAGLDIRQCDCAGGVCGPVAITDNADGTQTLRCVYTCPPGEICRIHRDGVDTGVSSINSSTVPPGQQITCSCEPDQPEVCPLPPGQSLCATRQTVDCQDPATGETCKPQVVVIGNNLQVTAEKCDCLPDGPCGPVLFIPDAPGAVSGMISCDATCPAPGQCVIWRNGVSTGAVQAHSSTFAPGDALICDCDPPSDVCPLPPNQPWCDARQILDCKDGAANEQCGPRVVSVTTAGNIDVQKCDCFGDECGPVAITQGANGPIFRCVQQCPDGVSKCYIHRDGVSTGVSSIYVSTVAPGEQITCDCVGTPLLCPLDPNLDICLDRQQLDCQTTTAGETCKAKLVSFDQFGNPRADACECFADNGECGPVLMFPSPIGGWNVSCDQLCPDPTQQCVIFRNNASTGMISAHSSQFAAGDQLSCGCDPIPQECKPRPDGLACTPCPTPGLQCVPTVIQLYPGAVPHYRILDCECTDRCHIEPPLQPGAKPPCVGGCPTGPFPINKKCVLKKDPVTGGWRCRCVPVHPPLDPSVDAVLKNRYLSMTTGGSGLARGGEEEPGTAIRIKMDVLHEPQPPNSPSYPPPDFSAFEGESVWAGPVMAFNSTSNPPTLFYGALTQCDPHFEAFNGEFSVYGGEVAPSSEYTVQMVDQECADSLDEEDCYSDPLVLDTGRWGDVTQAFQDPGGPLVQPNVLDIAAVVDQIKDLPTAPGKTHTHLHFNTPDPTENVNVIDLASTVDGVKGFAYPYHGPCTCPSTVVCDDANACTNNGQCAGGRRCVGGVCRFVDPCNRCTP